MKTNQCCTKQSENAAQHAEETGTSASTSTSETSTTRSQEQTTSTMEPPSTSTGTSSEAPTNPSQEQATHAIEPGTSTNTSSKAATNKSHEQTTPTNKPGTSANTSSKAAINQSHEQTTPANKPGTSTNTSDTQLVVVVPQGHCSGRAGNVDTTLNQDEVPNKHLIMKIVPYIEVYVFGSVSFALFVIQAMTHFTCGSALRSALNNKQMKQKYNASIIAQFEDAKEQYEVLLPYNILTIIFIGLQVSKVSHFGIIMSFVPCTSFQCQSDYDIWQHYPSLLK